MRIAFRAPHSPRADLAGADAEVPSDCRKCGAPLASRSACQRCGLAADRADAWASAQPRAVTELMRAWTAAVADWDEPAAHDRVAAVAVRREQLPWLARRYREVARARPGDAVVRSRLDRIVTITVAAVRATQSPGASSFVRRVVGLAVMAFLVVLVGGAMFNARQSSAQSGRRRPAPAMSGARPRLHGALTPDFEGRAPRPPGRRHVGP